MCRHPNIPAFSHGLSHESRLLWMRRDSPRGSHSWQTSPSVAHGCEQSPRLAPARSLGHYPCLDSCFFFSIQSSRIMFPARSVRLLNVLFGHSFEPHPSPSFLACPTVLFPLALKCLWRLQYLALIKPGLGASAPSLRNWTSRSPIQPARGMCVCAH
ncbi:hypothetical protein CGRA01v4_10646 [Colletotrichum graminicola]|nr:hypothetical protein CGRA01v4_10646 [Colletotrichum graminicola]